MDPSLPEERLSKLFVGGLSHDTTMESMKAYFEQFGEVKECKVIHDSVTKKPRGFGYLTFQDHNHTMDVLNAKHDKGPHVIDGKECEVKRAIPRDAASEFSHEKTNKIFMGGLHEDATKDDVERLLTEKLGKPPLSVSLMMRKDDHTKNRGYCFVELPTNDDADTLFCIRMIEIKGKPAEIKKSDPKGRGRGGGGGRDGGGRGGHNNGSNVSFGDRHGPGNTYYPSAYGGAFGYGATGYGAIDQYAAASQYPYDSVYGGGYSPYYGYTGYDGYSGMGTYSQSTSGYGPHKGGQGSTGRGYRPY